MSKRGATSRDVNYNKVSIIPTRERGEKILKDCERETQEKAASSSAFTS